MQTQAAERRRQHDRGRRPESGQDRAEHRGKQPRAAGSSARRSEQEIARWAETIVTRQQKHHQTGRGEDEEEEEEPERGRRRSRSRGDAGRRSRRAASEGVEQSERLRWRLHQLEKEKLELTSKHNQELCRLQAELTRLRASVERGEAQRVELQYQLTVSQRDAKRASELSRDKHKLTERGAELQQMVEELQKALNITRRAREEDQHALQQEVEERDKLIQSFSSENQRLHLLLQDQEEALEESERRMIEVQREREKEAEVNRRQANEMKYLTEREEKSRREKELSDQRVKCLESSVEAERAAHLESKFNSEIVQLRVRDLEAALAVERSVQQEAQCSVELLRERSDTTERALQRLQAESDQLSVALETERKMTSDLTGSLDDEKRRHADTHTLLEQVTQRQSAAEDAIRDTLQLHTGACLPAKDCGSPPDVVQLLKTTLNTWRHRLETTDTQLQDLLCVSERLQVENTTLRQLTSDQSTQLQEERQLTARLEEEVTRLRQESSDWLTQSRGLKAELEREREELKRERAEREREKEEREREKEEREREKEEREREEREKEREREEREREKEEREREKEREKEEREREKEREKEERMAEVEKMADHHKRKSEAQLSFLYCIYQRLLAGCVLLHQPQSIMGNFTWEELCDVISEHLDQLTSDLQKANSKIAHLQSVCDKKSVCVRRLQHSQECVLSRLEESVRRREEAWSSRHTHTVTQLQNELQLCRSQCDSLRNHASSLERRCSSLTSDLTRLQGLLSRSRRESASFLSACALLGKAMRHTHHRLHALSEQKTLLSRRLAEREAMEEEVRRLAGALGGEEDEEEGRRRRAVRRWRRIVCVVLAVRRWCALAKQTTVLFQVETGGGGSPAATLSTDKDDDDEGGEGVCARWLHSKRFSSIVLSSMSDLQAALSHTGTAPPDVMSASRSALSRLLDHILDQSDAASCLSRSRLDEDTLSSRLRLGLSRLTPLQPSMKALVSTLQQHFLLFSQRLHSAEVERRSLRLEVANLKRGLRQEREETVPAERFHSVCAELRQALSREQEAQTLLQEQTNQLHTLQLRVNTHTAEQADTQHTLSHTAQSLTEAWQEVSRKERSLRILGKHLSGVQRNRKQLEVRLQQVEEELREADRRKDRLIIDMKAAEASYKELHTLVQSRRSLSAQPRPPLPLPREHLELSGAESMMGAPELVAYQSLLSTFAQLHHTCSSRIDWLEEEVSAHQSHVTALRSELQDVCLRDNLSYIPVAQFPEKSPSADPVPLSDWSQEPAVSLSTTPSQTCPAPSADLSEPPKTKETKAAKNRGGRRWTDGWTDRK